MKFKFDFEIGHLIKSPCKECETRMDFPACIDRCHALDRIHTAMTDSISCTRNG